MNANDPSPANAKKLQQLWLAIEHDLPQVLVPKFFGSFIVELGVQDGTIQNIRRKVERIEK